MKSFTSSTTGGSAWKVIGESWVRLVKLDARPFILAGIWSKLPVAGAYCGVDASATQSPQSVVPLFAVLPTTWVHGGDVVHRRPRIAPWMFTYTNVMLKYSK
jgi:hypothetical protein